MCQTKPSMTEHRNFKVVHRQAPNPIQMQVFVSSSQKQWFLIKFTFGEQFLQGVPGKGATDLQPLRHDSGCDEFVVGNFFVQLVVGSLVEEHQVVKLVPHFSLGPLLLRAKEVQLVMLQSSFSVAANKQLCKSVRLYMPSSWLCLQTCWLGPCPFWTSQRPSSYLAWEAEKIKTLVSTVDGKTTEAARWSCWCVITTK